MLDIAVSYNKYKFLGNDFLTWLWFIIETDKNINEITGLKENQLAFEIGNAIVLENSLGENAVEKISIKGDNAGLEEGATALKKGAVVTQINLILKIDDMDYQFTIKGESMNITGLKTPPVKKGTTEDDTEGAVLEKIYLTTLFFTVIDNLFFAFIKKRISQDWKNDGLNEMRTWVTS